STPSAPTGLGRQVRATRSCAIWPWKPEVEPSFPSPPAISRKTSRISPASCAASTALRTFPATQPTTAPSAPSAFNPARRAIVSGPSRDTSRPLNSRSGSRATAPFQLGNGRELSRVTWSASLHYRKLELIAGAINPVETNSNPAAQAEGFPAVLSDDSAQALAVHIMVVDEVGDWHEALHEQVGKLDEESMFSQADDESIEFIPQPACHVGHLLPFHQLPLGVRGSAFGL